MPKWLQRKIALAYIKESMGHENSEDRNLIFNTINSALSEKYNKENFETLFFSLVMWILKNNHDFIKHSFDSGIDFLNTMESITVQAVQRSFQDIVYK